MIPVDPAISAQSYSPPNRSHSVEFWSTALAFLLTALFFASALLISARRMFWYDEIFTTLNTRLPSWEGMWRAVNGAADPTPFGFFALARISDQLFGPGEIGIRIPSAVAVAIGIIVTYLCARRLTGGFHALLAIALLFCSCLPFYASEGRAYGLFFLCSTLALWCWLRRSAWAIGAVFFAGTFTHFYMVLCIVPFVAAEALQWRRWSWPPRPLLAAAAGALASLIVQAPHITANRHFYTHSSWWASPDLHALQGVYDSLFPSISFGLALILLCYAISATRKTHSAGMSDAERVGWLFALIPLMGFVSATLVTNAFTPRYFISVLPGIAVAFSCLIQRAFGEQRRLSAVLFAILLGFGGFKILKHTRHPEVIETFFGSYQAEVRDVLGHEERIWLDGKKFTVVPSLLLLPARYYSHHPERYTKWATEPPPPDAMIPGLFTDILLQHAREIAFVNPETALLEKLGKANVRLQVKKVGSVTLVYAE